MKYTIEFEAGKDTCAIKPGKFCEWVVTTKYGQIFHCSLFHDLSEPYPQELREKDGWLQRCPECKKRAKAVHDGKEKVQNKKKKK